jgi:NAD(P)-dependent dehydrogenase (short-subunit alcohol dehydrogenase family)
MISPLGGSFTKIWHKDTYPFIDPATQSNHTGHYVLITGASKGVGRATALSFASAGAAGIALGARSDFGTLSSEILSASSKAGKAPPKILSLKLDVANYGDIEAAVKEVEREFGKLDILINNAGYLSPFETILDTPMDDYWRNYEINVRGVYWVTKAFLPLMLKGGEKTIVNLSSRAAMGLRHGGSGYQVTKMAVAKFTEFLMVEYGDQGLLAWSCHPCGALTELATGVPKDFHASESSLLFGT